MFTVIGVCMYIVHTYTYNCKHSIYFIAMPYYGLQYHIGHYNVILGITMSY